jgi:hypothetical protein
MNRLFPSNRQQADQRRGDTDAGTLAGGRGHIRAGILAHSDVSPPSPVASAAASRNY